MVQVIGLSNRCSHLAADTQRQFGGRKGKKAVVICPKRLRFRYLQKWALQDLNLLLTLSALRGTWDGVGGKLSSGPPFTSRPPTHLHCRSRAVGQAIVLYRCCTGARYRMVAGMPDDLLAKVPTPETITSCPAAAAVRLARQPAAGLAPPTAPKLLVP